MINKLLLITLICLGIPISHLAAQEKASGIKSGYFNIITVKAGLGSFSGHFATSAGLEYECFVNREGRLSLILPVNAYYGKYTTTGYTYNGTITFHGVYTAVGFNFHLIGNRKRIDPAVGASFGFGRNNETSNINGGDLIHNTNFNSFNFQFGVNVHVSEHMVAGAHLLTGYIPLSVSSYDDPHGVLLQAGLKFGYCF